LHLINGGGGTRLVFDTVRRVLNIRVRVEGWDRVVVERELYFDFRDFFTISSFVIHSAKLTITISDVGVWAFNPFTIQDKLTIMFNGYVVYEGRSFKGTRTFDIKRDWITGENYVTVTLDGGRNNWCWLEVSNVVVELYVSYSEQDRPAVINANESSTRRNREYLESVINTPSPNTKITPLGVTGSRAWSNSTVKDNI